MIPFETVTHNANFCVVGGGMAGLCAAVAAARRGTKTVLMQDRSVLGGNASSEIRMWISGFNKGNTRVTGILEEILLENFYRNQKLSFSIWDSVLYEKARFEPNITLLLNCSCLDAETDGAKIRSVTGWQTTTQVYHKVEAEIFADCSGDSVLAPLTGAEYRVGREAKSEFGESIPPDTDDNHTMGMSCLMQLRETDSPQPFVPPDWAYSYPTDAELPYKNHDLNSNFWWIELGGMQDSIRDTEELRDELLKIAFGVWDHMKNRGNHGCENWILDWMEFLPGKRESRRYAGAVTVTQNDVEAAGRNFPDIVAYGGWSMDDHFPEGFHYRDGHPTIYHPAPCPWGIPYRALYSLNVKNLYFAGRNISVTHAALSSSRVMATCALLGQAVGTAASLAKSDCCTPEAVNIPRLQQTLMEDDCWLPFVSREIPLLTVQAHSSHPVLKNGKDRPDESGCNGAVLKQGESVVYSYDSFVDIERINLVFDSDLNRWYHNMPHSYPLKQEGYTLPETLMKTYALALTTPEGVMRIENTRNRRRFVTHKVGLKANKIELVPLETWGSPDFRVFSMYVY
ncbi:MAG: FAD-dependent oxidoreductase [Oscillospiraceae bacterium]|jgi:hypothetical protein|nr:FAD-dependent oxidoreductase [Oscillospiraceae bacterium]